MGVWSWIAWWAAGLSRQLQDVPDSAKAAMHEKEAATGESLVGRILQRK